MELTNINILLFLIPLSIMGFSIYKYQKTDKKPYLYIAFVIFILILFQPFKFTPSEKVQQTRQSFDSTPQPQKEITKSVDQRSYSQDRDSLKAQAKQQFEENSKWKRF